MAKRAKLSQLLSAPISPMSAPVAERRTAKRPPSREGLVPKIVYVPPPYDDRLALLARRLTRERGIRCSQQALLLEAVEDVLAKYREPTP